MKIKSIFHLLALSLLIVFGSSACIEITYETTVKKDGSGSQTVSMDLTKYIDMMSEKKGLDDESLESEFQEGFAGKMDSVTHLLDSLGGISNYQMGLAKNTFSYSYDFESFHGMRSIPGNDFNKAGKEMNISRKGKKSTLSWKLDVGDITEIIGEESDEEALRMVKMMSSFFEGMEVTSIFYLPGKVTKVSDKSNMRVSKDKRTVILKAEMLDILEGKVPEEYFIQYK